MLTDLIITLFRDKIQTASFTRNRNIVMEYMELMKQSKFVYIIIQALGPFKQSLDIANTKTILIQFSLTKRDCRQPVWWTIMMDY